MTLTGILCIIVSSVLTACAAAWVDNHWKCNCCGKLLKEHSQDKEC